jgi:cysteine synthase
MASGSAFEIVEWRDADAASFFVAWRQSCSNASDTHANATSPFGAEFGIPVNLCVSASASPERLTVLRALGAEVIPMNASWGSDGAVLRPRRMATERPNLHWYANQYNNPAHSRAY